MLEDLPIPVPELIFVYNVHADASVYTATMDFVHRAVSPQTYEQQSEHDPLCRVTHGPEGIKLEWKEFLDALPYKILFYHREEFKKLHPDYVNMKFPAVFVRPANEPMVPLMEAQEIYAISTADELKEVITEHLKNILD